MGVLKTGSQPSIRLRTDHNYTSMARGDKNNLDVFEGLAADNFSYRIHSPLFDMNDVRLFRQLALC